MGGSAIEEDWELDLTSPTNGRSARTLVLVGRTGNGKSATGNSILGRKAFKSRACSSGVTVTSELQTTVLTDGQEINVIDTPGMFDFAAGSDFVGKEIVKCIDMAKDGIHAVLVVFSVRTRFSLEEEAALRSLQTLFGSKIVNYMIVVFTGGDELEENEETLEDYLGRSCPDPLKDILVLCQNRCVLFDNKTKDEGRKVGQVQQLLSLVNGIVMQNGGQPYSDELFSELKAGAMKLRDQQKEVDSLEGYTRRELKELKEQMHRSYDEQLKRITEMMPLVTKTKFNSKDFFLANLTCCSHLAKTVSNIKNKLTPRQLYMFSLVGKLMFNGPLCHNILLREVDERLDDVISFKLLGDKVSFEWEEFDIITGLRYKPKREV